MATVLKAFFLAVVVLMGALMGLSPSYADDTRMKDHILGKADAPIKVDEFVSLTCTHCADFYTNTLPVLEKNYIDTGKVRFVLHDFPLDGISLKAAAVARCMPDDEYFPFIKTLYANQASWAFGQGNPETNLLQYAKLGGLSADKAKACINDADLQNLIIASRESSSDKFKVSATPTFVINDGVETIQGAQSPDTFAKAFDRQLAAKK